MVTNGGHNSAIAGLPQFPRLQSPGITGQFNPSASPSPFPSLPSLPELPKTDSLSLSTTAPTALSNLASNPIPAQASTTSAVSPLSNASSTASAFLPVSANRTGFPGQAPTAGQPASSTADSALSSSLPAAPQSGAASATESAATPASPAANQSVKPAAANAASALASSTQPVGPNGLSPAQQTGKQVGDTVTKLLEEVPALQEKISQVDWETLSQEEVMPKLEKLRVAIQPTFSHVPKFVDRKVARLFEDPKSQQMATQFFDWLRKEPDPETLASLEADKNRPGRDGLDEEEGPRPNRHRPSRRSEDEFADDELASSEKQSFIGKWRNRVKDAYGNLKDRLSSRKSEDKPSSHGSHSSKPGGRMSDEDSADELDLDSLLRGASRGGGSRLDELGGSGAHRHRPMRDDY